MGGNHAMDGSPGLPVSAALHAAPLPGLSAGEYAGRLVALIAVCVLALGLVRSGLRRIRYGRRRPWLSLWLRLRLRLHPGPGFASAWSLWRRHGLPAARKVARRARPSLSWWARRIGPWRSYAAFVGSAQGWLVPRRVYASLESLRLVIAAPQEGKSADAAGTILDAPGAVVATSIRGDLISLTAGLRERRGRVHVFNPEETGDFGSTFRWNPASGCEDMAVAVRRAGYMVEASTARGLADETFWTDQASLTIGAYLHAGGLVGADMRHIYQWITGREDAPVRVLSAHPDAEPVALSQVVQFLSLPDRTQAGVATTISSVLRFMQHPNVVASLCPGEGAGFDFEAFVSGGDTLYLVASDGQTSPVPPLFVAICAEITDAARRVGGARRPARPPRGPVLGSARLGELLDQIAPPPAVARLDPPLTMVLDEVANIAPIPVAAWATWAAGAGIWLHLYAQAWAQLEERWGEHGAAVIWQACKTKVIYTGTSELELCQMVQELCGYVRVRGPDEIGYSWRGTLRRRPTSAEIPVLPVASVRQLPPGRAVVIQGSAPPTIVRTEQVWRRADYRAWRRSGHSPDLPGPLDQVTAEPMPYLLAPAEQWPPAPPDELAARRGRTSWPETGPGETRDRGGSSQRPVSGRPPEPPSRPAPWRRPEEGDDDDGGRPVSR